MTFLGWCKHIHLFDQWLLPTETRWRDGWTTWMVQSGSWWEERRASSGACIATVTSRRRSYQSIWPSTPSSPLLGRLDLKLLGKNGSWKKYGIRKATAFPLRFRYFEITHSMSVFIQFMGGVYYTKLNKHKLTKTRYISDSLSIL